jgi:hypothetical protein
MSVIVTKAVNANDYHTGTRIVGVSPQGTAYSYDSSVANEGAAALNTRWGDRFDFSAAIAVTVEE